MTHGFVKVLLIGGVGGGLLGIGASELIDKSAMTVKIAEEAARQYVMSTCNEDEVALWNNIGNGGWYCVKGHHVIGVNKP